MIELLQTILVPLATIILSVVIAILLTFTLKGRIHVVIHHKYETLYPNVKEDPAASAERKQFEDEQRAFANDAAKKVQALFVDSDEVTDTNG